MGIVNLTPDSFYDGGLHQGVEGLAHALRLLDQGADVVDLGAESTRPGATPVSQEEELSRLLPVLAGMRRLKPSAVISVDTYHASTASTALEMGASIINDVTACGEDPELLDVLVQYKPGYVLTHPGDNLSQQNDCGEDMRHHVRAFFASSLARLVRSGLPEERIVLDPGIGFGKSAQQNLTLLAHPEDWLEFERPIVMGLSNKSVFGILLGLPVAQRGTATTAATALLWRRGVFWHRVHDVVAARQALTVSVALR
ncbi:MAG: dihydropteroate synthase [Desulfovibrio sp.]|nr:dihydropteroate synthase [Desulfovibrio sp.]